MEAVAALDCVDIVAPTVSSNYTLSQSNGNTVSATVTGVIPDYLTVTNYVVEKGTYITQEQMDEKSMVIVIGSEISESLFSNTNSNIVGETVRIMGQPYKIIGVLESKGSSSLGTSQDQVAYIPLTTAQNRLITRQKNSVSQISITVKDTYTLTQAETMIEELMRDRHGIFDAAAAG